MKRLEITFQSAKDDEVAKEEKWVCESLHEIWSVGIFHFFIEA